MKTILCLTARMSSSVADRSGRVPSRCSTSAHTQQSRMAFVHVIAADVVVAKFRQDLDAADAEYRFLAQPVVGVAAVEIISERLVPGECSRQGTCPADKPARYAR